MADDGVILMGHRVPDATRAPLFEWQTLPDGKKTATLLFEAARPRLVDALELCGVPPHVMQEIHERAQAPPNAGSVDEEEDVKRRWAEILGTEPSGDKTLQDATALAMLPMSHWRGKGIA
ncbi:hypothetical protein T484DRAFT_1837734 [Baffinella frigidus]|nr:hypothetical protein T484DRAFT_1837734 [Cryptophyta sp. CCMP2293]